MKVLLIDADGERFPNLALMKLSTYHKTRGDEVSFGSCGSPDVVYISCVFTWNKVKAMQSATFYPDAKIHYGGTGIDLTTTLPEEVDSCKPDYTLYPFDYSLGFATRGCIRICSWCVVPKKEGIIRLETPLKELVDSTHDKVILLDNNILSHPEHIRILEELISINKKTSFSQGLDIRLINKDNARLLSKIKYYDIMFKNRRLHFAWDEPELEDDVHKGIKILLESGIRPRHLMFYVLIGFNTTYEQDIYRVKTLLDLKTIPYVMLYNNKKGTYHHHLKRWTERRYCYVVPWEEYDWGNSQEVIRAENGFPISNEMRRLDVGVPPKEVTK